jgi:hypothetical protein
MSIAARIRNYSASLGATSRPGTRKLRDRPAYTLTGDGCSKTENSFHHRVLFTPREQFT